jgi:hypothetical protein
VNCQQKGLTNWFVDSMENYSRKRKPIKGRETKNFIASQFFRNQIIKQTIMELHLKRYTPFFCGRDDENNFAINSETS